jgi:Fe-S-cluster containining protein
LTHAAPALEAVQDKVDGFFARVAARYPNDLACGPGCTDCCAPGLTVTPLEADAVESYLRALDPVARARIAERAAASDGSACAALDGSGRCSIYPVRPLVCRSHGVVVRIERGDRTSLPVLDACPKNFRAHDLATIDRDCVLDQRTLSTLVAALHGASKKAPTQRRELRALLQPTRKESPGPR